MNGCKCNQFTMCLVQNLTKIRLLCFSADAHLWLSPVKMERDEPSKEQLVTEKKIGRIFWINTQYNILLSEHPLGSKEERKQELWEAQRGGAHSTEGDKTQEGGVHRWETVGTNQG